MKIDLKSTHREDLDEIHVTVTQDDAFLCEIAICPETVYIAQHVDLTATMPVVNNTHFIALVLNALLAATDDETDIPMCVDASFDL